MPAWPWMQQQAVPGGAQHQIQAFKIESHMPAYAEAGEGCWSQWQCNKIACQATLHCSTHLEVPDLSCVISRGEGLVGAAG